MVVLMVVLQTTWSTCNTVTEKAAWKVGVILGIQVYPCYQFQSLAKSTDIIANPHEEENCHFALRRRLNRLNLPYMCTGD